jgi:hypothetical protein
MVLMIAVGRVYLIVWWLAGDGVNVICKSHHISIPVFT